jgi:hypothetical protein
MPQPNPINSFGRESGVALQSQVISLNLWTGTTPNVYYPLTGNPSGFLTNATVGGVNFITATGTPNSGVVSGNVVLTGAGNVSVFTGINRSIVISGDTGAYGVFALKSETGQFVVAQQTGLLTNVFYPLNSNPLGYLTASSGVGVRMIVPTGTSQSGNISGNVIFTGAGNVTVSTGISGHIVVSGNTGAYANFVTLSQTGNVVNTSQTGGFASIQVTGSPLLPLVNLTGTGNVTVTTGGVGGSLVTINGNTGAYANFVTLSQTGNVVNTSQTGGFLTLGNVGGVRTIQTTGAFPSGIVSGNIVVSGAGNINVFTGVNGTIIISGTGGGAQGTAAGVNSIAATGTTNTGYFTGDVMFSGAGNIVVSTGTPLNKIIVISGNTGAYANFYPLVGNPSGFLQGTTGTGVLDGQLLIGSTGINGFQQGDLSATSGLFVVSGSGSLLIGADSTLVRTSQTGGFGGSSVRVTGGSVSNPNFTGIGSVTVTTGGNGLVLISGNATGTSSLNKMWIPAAAMTPSQITGATTGQIFTAASGHTIDTLNFLSGSGQSAYFNLSFPRVWDKSVVTPVFYWTTTGNVGTINWGIAGANIDDGTRLDVLYNQGATITDSTISGNYLHQTTGAPLTISGSLSDDDQCYFKVYRSAGGSLADDGKLIGVGLAYLATGTASVSVGSGPGTAAGVNTIGATGITNTGYFTGDVLFSGAGSVVVSTGNQTSKVIVISGTASASNTGELTGVFYPLIQNPSGYVREIAGSIYSTGFTGNILDGQLLIGSTGSNAYVRGNLMGVSGIVVVSGSGSLTIAPDATIVRTGQTGALTNQFYPLNSNPAGYITSSSAGVTSITTTGAFPSGTVTGAVKISGAGTVTTYTGISGLIIISGTATAGPGGTAGVNSIAATGIINTGFFTGDIMLSGAGNVTVSTGTPINKLIVISGNTGSLTSAFYPLNQNPSGYISSVSGVLTVSGSTGILNGQLLIGSTGDNAFIQGNLAGSSGIFVQSGSGSLIIGADSTIVRTSQTGGFGGGSVSVTGATVSSPNFTGAGNVLVYTGNNPLVIVSGDTGAYANFVTLSQTGNVVNTSMTGSLTNVFYPLNSNPVGYLTATTSAIEVTGSINTGSITGRVRISGAGSVTTFTGTSGLVIISGTVGGGSIQVTGATVSNPNFTGVGSITVTTGGGGLIYISGLLGNTSPNKIWIPAAAMTPSQTTGASTGQVFTASSGHTIDTLNFLSGSGQSAYFNVSFPKVWNKSPVTPVLYWTTTGNVGTINWGVAAAGIDDGTRLDILYNQGTTITDSTISGNYLHQTTGAPLTISGTLMDDEHCYFKVYRSAGGTLSDEAKLLGVGIEYTQTGLVGGGGLANTGELTGVFYPLNTNPSGYVTSLTGAHEVWIPANAITPGAVAVNAPTISTLNTGNLTLDTLDFPQTGYYQGHFTYTFPNSWNTSTVKGQFYWTESGVTGTTGTVVWGLAGATIKNNGLFDIQFNTGQLVTGISVTGLRMHQAVTPFLTISGNPSIGDTCFFKVYRNSGSLSGSAKLIGISLQYYHTGISTIVY